MIGVWWDWRPPAGRDESVVEIRLVGLKPLEAQLTFDFIFFYAGAFVASHKQNF